MDVLARRASYDGSFSNPSGACMSDDPFDDAVCHRPHRPVGVLVVCVLNRVNILAGIVKKYSFALAIVFAV